MTTYVRGCVTDNNIYSYNVDFWKRQFEALHHRLPIPVDGLLNICPKSHWVWRLKGPPNDCLIDLLARRIVIKVSRMYTYDQVRAKLAVATEWVRDVWMYLYPGNAGWTRHSVYDHVYAAIRRQSTRQHIR